MRRTVIVAVGVLVALGGLGHYSGTQPPRDAVAAAQRALEQPLDARRIDVGEVSLFVVRAGPPDGPPIVLLHGFPEFWYAWAGVIRPLTQAGFHVILPDQRGYGDSDKPADVDAYRIDHLGDDVAGLIQALGYTQAFVVAHDWGGGVAWNVALRHPQRVRKLAVLDTPHPDVRLRTTTHEESISWYRTFFQLPWLPEESARWGNWYVTAKMLRDTAAPGAFPDEKLDLYRAAWDRDGAFRTMVHWYRAAFRYPIAAASERRVTVPTLVLVAKHDAFIPSDLTRASVGLCDDARLVELGVGTHWVAQEAPDQVAQVLLGFFRP